MRGSSVEMDWVSCCPFTRTAYSRDRLVSGSVTLPSTAIRRLRSVCHSAAAKPISRSRAAAATFLSCGLSGGVVVKKINEGAINDQTRMRDGFIITKANGKTVNSIDDLKNIIGSDKQVTIEGVYPGYSEPFQYPLDLDDSGE